MTTEQKIMFDNLEFWIHVYVQDGDKVQRGDYKLPKLTEEQIPRLPTFEVIDGDREIRVWVTASSPITTSTN
jgi:hypothetical protein